MFTESKISMLTEACTVDPVHAILFRPEGLGVVLLLHPGNMQQVSTREADGSAIEVDMTCMLW